MEFVPPKIYEFGEFRLDAGARILWRGNSIADITPKAAEILLVLVENSGRIISKEEIFKEVWADSFVEEANLTHHVFRLRKALENGSGQEYIQTIPKRGYRFVAEVREAGGSGPGRKLTWMITAFVFAAAILIAGLLWYKLNSPKPAQAVAERPPMSISRITNSGKVAGASISPDGNFIAYIQNYMSGEGMLYVRQIKANTEVKLLQPGERVFGTTAFSPDGAFIYYIAFEKDDPAGSLYRIPVIGGQPVKVVSNARRMFSLSSDGKRAAFYRTDAIENKTSLIVAALDGSGGEQVVRVFDNGSHYAGGDPAISPDGRLIAISLAETGPGVDLSAPRSGLMAVDTQSGELKPLTDQKWTEIGKASWMPDGGGIVFVASRPRTGNQIYFLSYPRGELRQITGELNSYGNYGMAITADGTTLVADLWESQAQLWSVAASGEPATAEQLTSGVSDGAHSLAVLADGRTVYSARTGEEYDLWIMSESNGEREGRPLTSDPALESGACATPDGRYIVFGSDRAGRKHLFRITPDGSGLTQLTFGDTYDSSPDCSPDGRSVIYNAGGIWSIPVDGGTPAQLSDQDCVVPTYSPDGKSIACILPSDSVIKNATLAIISSGDGALQKTFGIIPYGWYHRPVKWTPDGKAIVFSKLENNTNNLWKQDISGGKPKPLTNFKSEIITRYIYTRDGRRLIISRGHFGTNIVMIKNFM